MRKKKILFSTEPFPAYNYPQNYMISPADTLPKGHHTKSANIQTNTTNTPIIPNYRSPLDSPSNIHHISHQKYQKINSMDMGRLNNAVKYQVNRQKIAEMDRKENVNLSRIMISALKDPHS